MLILYFFIFLIFLTFLIFLIFSDFHKVKKCQNGISEVIVKLKSDHIKRISRQTSFSLYNPHLINSVGSVYDNSDSYVPGNGIGNIFLSETDKPFNRIQANHSIQLEEERPIKLIKTIRLLPQNDIVPIEPKNVKCCQNRRKQFYVFFSSNGIYHKSLRCINLVDPEPILLSDAVCLKMNACPLCFP